MRSAIGAALSLVVLMDAQAQVRVRRGMVITRSTTLARATYRLAAPASLDSALITIRGDDITLDLGGATIDGAAAGAEPDQYAGVAIRIEGGSRVTIRNGTIRGFRFGIRARGTSDLALRALDVSRSWRPRLYSLVEHESIVDWLSFHHNEKGEWLRYGAGLYLDGVTGGEITGVTARQGMNALLCVRCDGLRIHDNDLSFNSGLGIGFYRSTHNRIVHNRIDYDVRGYSHGFYSRGQDSADLLFFEQSSNNVVAYNSATHGGDGFFLWAGQSTMDSGEGGANYNTLFGNDFSYAPANAIEATFSRNLFVANRLAGSDYGVWGGYSFNTGIVANCFAGDRIGIAIEHGQDDWIGANRFDSVTTAVRLWADSIEPGDWGYPKHHDTRSRDATIVENEIMRAHVGVFAANTRSLSILRNAYTSVDTLYQLTDTSAVTIDGDSAGRMSASAVDACSPMPPVPSMFANAAPAADGIAHEVPLSVLARHDRSSIIVDEWGPYDWRTPKLWPVDSTRAVPLRLAVLGPAGKWRTVAQRGLQGSSKKAGDMNETITVTPTADATRDWSLTLEYLPAKGAPVRFSYGAFEPAQRWHVRFFATADTARRDSGATIDTANVPRLDLEWYRPKLARIPLTDWGLDATSTMDLAPGAYTLRTISDDAVRVWVDGKLAIDDWTPHESVVDVAPLAGGHHELRVQYYQRDGWVELRLDILRGTQRAGGSPGPH